MSAWNIYHKDGSKLTDVNGEQITVHGLEYSDSWMGECFLTINFKHEVPINFQIGDYIVYRGERFELNYEPGKDKQARPDTYGEGFVYDSVKFNALQDELARAEFLDVVLNDNELHYTALPKFPFYVQTLDDLLDRIQACLNEQIGAGLWKIYSRNKDRSVQRGALESEWLSVYGEKTDDNVIESMSITVDSQTCWQALALVNEKWDINFIVRGRNIYVGTTGIQANHIFKYGLGNGLYEIVQNADSDQSVVTRLRAYGSEKNLPSHYYADLGVKYVANITKVVGASTNVTLELDLDYIETYFKNPRKYIVPGETGEQSLGWVLKVTFDFKTEITGYVTQAYDSKKCRFYSELKGTQTDTGDEESKEKLDAFIAQVKAGNTKMYITSGLNKKAVPSSMKEYAKNLPNNMSINRLMLPGFPHVSLSDFYNTLTDEEKKYVNPTGRQHKFSTDPHRPYIDSINIEQIGLRSASQFFETDDKTNGVIEIYPTIEEMEIGGVRVDEIDEGVAPDDDGRFGDNETVKNVDIYLKKAIDFDINDLKDDDFSISMKDGMCGGRTFKVASSAKIDGRWRLTIERVKDDALELWFPYKDYPIKNGDHFVLTGITLPDSYVNAASLKLLKYAIAFIDKNDYTRYVYQPKVDEIFMARQHDLAEKDTTGVIKSLHDTLKAGDLMEFEDTDLRIGGVISIDQLTIKEEDGKIPTYDITLREDKEVGTIQKIQQQISSLQSGNGGTGAGLTTTQVKGQIATEGSKHFISKITDDTAKGTVTWEKVQKFLQGLLVGNSNNENGGSWTTDAEGRSHLITDYLEVRMKAIFEELVINKTSTIGGKEIISPAGGVVAHKVEEVTVTYNNVSQKAYRCYFLAEQEGDAVDNDFAVGDQVRSESFNVRKGTYHKAGNHFYWRLVIGRDEDPVELEGKKYHYIDLSDTDCATASDVPAKGDVLNQCGNRTDAERQNCLIFSAVDTYSPSISLYHGINSYSFANREYVEYGVNKQTNKAFFNVYGDMYVGDRPTKENGYEGSSYIRYDSSTKQVSVKGKISAKSTVDGKELSQYIKENTDDTVANAAIKAAEDAQKAAQNAQKDITILGNTVTGNKKEFDNYVTNGYLEPSEIAAMAQDSKRLEDDFAAAQKSYNEVKNAEVLKDTKELTDLNTAFATLTSAKTELVTYLSEISTNYNKADTNGKAAIVSAVGTKFTNFQSAYSAFYDKLGLANAYITRKIYGDLGVVIGDVSTYQYLKKVLADGVETEINGGLILTSLIALRDHDTKRVESGINGVIDKTAKGNGIATWWGGYMNDGEVVGFDKKEDYSKQAATSLVRFDGSGYMANGAIWWGTDGKVHADPTSFIISEKNLGAYLTFFEPTWKAGSAGTSVADLVSLKPNAPFSKLGVSGDATFEGAISFHGIKLTYDSTNKAIKIDGNLYTTGGITAYGAGASTTGGGGLIASVISYARILEGSYTDADLTSIPNAYAIKALSSRIDNIATELGGLNLSWNNITGKPSTFTPSAHTHKWTEITDRITKVSQLTNDKGYLTAHQSLASYYTKAEIDAKGYTTNKGTVTSVALTLPTGLTCATKTITTSGTFAISLASGYSIPTTAKQTAWDGAVSAKHTHSNKSVLDGITSTKVTCWDSAYDWYALITTDEETADGVINKWNEVVSFLANIAQTDTLSGIVDGINKSISDEVTRAKKAEGVNASGISTNKTSITTLQGYFTSGSAKKALQLTNTHKLWGNSFNGTADINGSIIVPDGKYISIGNIKMEYDATNKALKITNTTTNEVANLYTSGGVSAYGVGTSSSSGGGLNGSVKSYSDALKLTSESLSEVASAYSIKALDSRISSLEGGSATAISVSGSGNAVTSVTKNGTTISIVKGSTFLTNHQSLDGYVNAISVSGSGNAITSVSKSGKGITFTKGATFLTSHQSLANYYTKSSVDSLLSGKSATSHTHSVKINGITKTIAASGGDAVDLGTYLTAHQSLAAYATQNWVKNEATAHNADMVDNYHASGLFTGFSISDVANKVTISIGGTSKALNLVRAFPSGVGNNFNDIATHGNSMGMSYIAAPYASSTANYQTLNGYVNPNGQTGWHHYINLSYTDSNNTATSPNMWQTQFAIKAGTTEVYVRSRDGGKISNSAAWAAPWVRLARVTDNVASASKVANALSWSGYSSGSYNGSAAMSISIPNNTNQLTNGAGFITSSASITGNAGSATKLQNARTINGTSFNGTANIVTSYWGTTRKLWGNSVNGNADVNGSITIANTDGVYVQIGDVRLVYDKANTAIKVVKSDGTTAANFYATGGITAYGEGSGSSGGGGLNGSVKSYADALKLASESLSEIASAYSIKQLSTRITSLEGGSATSISVSGGGNAVTSVTKNGTTISVVKGSTFLTAHQSLAGYMKTATADAKYMYHSRNNIVSDLNSFATNSAAHIYEMNKVTNRPNSNSWVQVMNWGTGDSSYGFLLANDYSTNGHMYFRQKIAGSWKDWKTIIDSSNIGSQSVNYAASAGSVAWTNVSGRPSTMKNPSALYWSGYSSGSYDGSAAKSISIPNNTNQLTNGAGFITASASITGNAATATKVNHSLSVFGKSFNGSADVTVADTDLIASISTATANLTDKTEILTSYASDNGFNDSNAKNRIYRRPASAIWGYINSKTISNADKLDNVHLNGIFTALSNTNNGVSMTIGTVAKSLANMQVYSATKLVTARNIALNGDLMGNANFDGSANITINGYMSYCNATVSNTNTYPWRRIAKVNELTGNYSDGCILLYISEGFIGGSYGIARVYIRTDNLSTGANASCSIQWISRNGYGLDSLKIAMYKTTGKAYYDVFFKMRGAYGSVVIRTLQDQRGGLGKRFILVNSTETSNAASHTEAYATIEDAATAIHNQAYTSIAQGSDVATVHNADMVDGIHASGLFTNLSNSGNSLSITVGGTNKTLTVNYASNAGNADTLDGVHASGLFTNLSNSGNNISITIGGTNKTLTAAYATNCDTVDGKHAQAGSSKPFGMIPCVGNDGVIDLGHYIDFHYDNTTGSDYSVRLQTDGNHSNVVTLPTATGTLALTSDNVASATKLQTTRTLWGQSFNGTANISGSMTGVGDMTLDAGARIKHGSGNLYIGNSDNSNWIGVQNICSQSSIGDGNWSLRTSGAAHFKDTTINGTATIKNLLSLVDGSHKGLKMGSTYISSLDGEVILQGNTALRFGNDAWDYNQWAGLKYDHSSKTVYLGIADGSIFKANSAQSGGVINLKQGISSVYTPALYAGGDIYHTGAYRMLWKNSKASKYLNVMNISQDDNGILTIGYGNFSNNKNVVLEGYNLNFRVGNDSGMKSMWLNYNNGNPVLSLDGNFYATGGVTAYKSSDERLKHDIHGVDSLAIIKAMGGTVAFRYNADNKDSIGWIAQRVLHNTFMQDLVEKDDKGFLKINYWSPKLIAVAFGAIEQVDDEVSRLKRRVRDLENEVEQLKSDRL